MSNLFVSELLILLLLFPVIIRPFFKSLKVLEGLVLFPSIALVLMFFIISAYGLTLTIIPLFLFSLLVFFVSLPRLIRFASSLKTDYFDASSRLIAFIFFFVFCGVLFLSIFFRSEPGYFTEASIIVEKKRTFTEQGLGLVLTKWEQDNVTLQRERDLVIYISEAGVSKQARPTLTRILAEQNIILVEPFLFGNNRTKSLCKSIQCGRSLSFMVQEIFQTKTRNNPKTYEEYHLKELELALKFAQEITSNIFIIAEGSAATALYNNSYKIPESIKGLVLLNYNHLVIQDKADPLVLDIESFFPKEAGNVDVLCLQGDKKYLLGYGELGGDDVLFARMLGVEKDTDRKKAEIVARKILSWIDLKRNTPAL